MTVADVPTSLPAWPQPDADLFVGRYRLSPAHFRVDEQPGWTPSGTGEHLLVRVEKRGANTAWVARALAARGGATATDVGYCGEKDRHAVTTQWFSLRDPKGRFDGLQVGDGDAEWSILERVRHDRKLRRGDHAANRFRLGIALDAVADPGGIEAALVHARERLARGVPNYFGPQRFGRDGGNIARAASWVEHGRLPGRGPERGRVLSTARSLLFNAVLGERVRRANFAEVLDGDVLDDGVPTGPLWGRGRGAAAGHAAAIEAVALAGYGDWCARLEHVGLTQERRALVLRPRGASIVPNEEGLELTFELPPGAFATAVLQGLGSFTDVTDVGMVNVDRQ